MHPFLFYGITYKYQEEGDTIVAIDPRKFFVKQCGNREQTGKNDDAKRKDFFNSVGKIGDIELLNNTAIGGKVSAGLRTLTKTSNSIRIGERPEGIIPKNGADVLIETGISQASAAEAGSFNPGVLNKATAQANNIADQVNNGRFNLEDIPGVFTDIQNLSTLADGIFKNATETDQRVEVCQASPYAMDLISYAPKFKFLFVMEFEFAEEIKLNGSVAAFVIKTCTRPNVSFEHEEVNMYNFWVQIPKRTKYEPMTMRFYDDNKNGIARLYQDYLNAVSPISNLSFPQKMEDRPQALEAQSMNFGAIGNDSNGPNGKYGGGYVDPYKHEYSASFGPIGINGTTKNVFRRITMYQIYNYGSLVNIYRFLNPKVTSMEMDEMNMAETGDGNEITVQFAYDTVNITNGVAMSSIKSRIHTLTSNGVYPINPKFDDESEEDTDDGYGIVDPEGEGGGFFSGVGNVIGNITGTATGLVDGATGLVSDAFTGVSNFAGSMFSDFSSGAQAGEASAKNRLGGDVPPGN